MKSPATILLSRTDRLGDVVLTLPVAKALKERLPGCRIVFLGRRYTKPVIEACAYVDEAASFDDMEGLSPRDRAEALRSFEADAIVHVFPNAAVAVAARAAGIPLRVGSGRRPSHWLTCNRLAWFSRRNSGLHEAQLNFKLLSALGIASPPALAELSRSFGLRKLPLLPERLKGFLRLDRCNLILHPGSAGNAPEWPAGHYRALVERIPPGLFNVILTGGEAEAERFKELAAAVQGVVNLMGKTSLSELVALIGAAQGFVSASTGPAHIAAALGLKVVALFSPRPPVHPGRWAPLGPHVSVLTAERSCPECALKGGQCSCMATIAPERVLREIKGAVPHRGTAPD